MTPREIACRELVELLAEYVEDALPPDEVAAVEQHLTTCEPCTRYLRQLRATAEALRMVPAERLTEGLSEQTVDTLVAAFRHRK